MNAAQQADRGDPADVVVVGAGPVGLTIANLLAQRDVRVLLVERSGDISDEPRAISITDESLRVMDDIGILDALKPEMLMNTGARYFGRKEQLLAEVKPRRSMLGYPGKSQFDQPVLARLLLDAARANANITLCFDTEADTLTQRDDGVEVLLKGRDGARRIAAKWLVACDGGRSGVRTQLGIKLEGSTQVQKWIVVDTLNRQGTPEPFSEFHCDGVRPGVVVPGVKGRCRYEFMLKPDDDPDAVIQPAFIAKLISPFQTIQPGDIRRSAVYIAHQRIAATFRVGRVLLAGDAAHMMPPFAGQGLNAGVRDAANLAWKIAAHVKGEAGDTLIDSYELERKGHAAEMVRLSVRIGKVVMSTHALGTVLRDWSVSALRLVPSIRRWLVEMRFLKQPHFTAGCVVAPGADLPASAARFAGRALPQPRVQVVSAGGPGEMPLDRLLGDDWAVLAFSADGTIEIRRAMHERQTVRDIDGFFADLAGSGLSLVVRPDRYVALVAPTASLDTALGALDTLMPRLRQRLAAGGRSVPGAESHENPAPASI
ncbi:MAG TPA: FAD-dependent monooxygenase [Paraburkholderia sp.]|jgi:3-(3-hydroxy-phenyl)propionate hydroxylase|uniref:FAD-dependent monooxygenase n=1 Tax=Paraburkholderia sp. TaxID=1926495 RepID=UPI002DEA895B|nr:FAD-dependent monooxygenase [Paraburkholderia sp.]